MLKLNRLLQSDINLLLNATEIFQLIFPEGYNTFLDYADKAMYDVCMQILNNKGFSIDEPLENVDEFALFALCKALERSVLSQPAYLKKLNEGKLIKIFKVSISKDVHKDAIYIYNIVPSKSHKFKFFFHMHKKRRNDPPF